MHTEDRPVLNRIVWLDYTKAIAIILVVLFHSGVATSKITSPLLAMCIPLFFVANGALILRKDRPALYFVRKIFKLLFIYLFWASISSLSTMLIKGDNITFPELMNSVIDMRMGYAHIYWFICTLIVLYCIYPAIQFSVRKPDVCFFLLVVSFLFSFKLFGYRIPILHIHNLLAGWEAECVFYAICGYAILTFVPKKNKKSRIILFIVSFVIIYAFQLLMYSDIPFFSKHTPKSVDDAVFTMYKSPCIMIITAIAVCLLKLSNLPYSRIIEIIGSNTLGIYVTHGLFMKVFRLFFRFDNFYFDHFLMFVFGLLLSLAFSYVMSKNKYTRFLVSL